MDVSQLRVALPSFDVSQASRCPPVPRAVVSPRFPEPFLTEQERSARTITGLSHDVLYCPQLTAKLGGLGAVRSIGENWYHVESRPLVSHGDVFLVHSRDDEFKQYTDPERVLPADWAAQSADPRREKFRALNELNKDRAYNVLAITWDFFTIRMRNGWHRLTVVYEKGTPSPFQYRYIDETHRGTQ